MRKKLLLFVPSTLGIMVFLHGKNEKNWIIGLLCLNLTTFSPIFPVVYSGGSYIQDYITEKQFKMSLLENCNNTLANITDENKIPEDCYYKMKWKKYKNQTTLTQNRNSMQEKGKIRQIDFS